jgi:hypothetical protein
MRTRVHAPALLLLLAATPLAAAPKFRAPFFSAQENACYDTAISDVTGDGIADLVVTGFANDAVLIQKGNGDGTFLPPTTVAGSDLLVLAIADVTGDGVVDVVGSHVSNYTTAGDEDASFGRLDVFEGLGGGAFAPPESLAIAPAPFGVIAFDFSGDGIADVAAADTLGVVLHRSLGAGAFDAPVRLATGFPCTGIEAVDLDGDGDLDLVASESYGTRFAAWLAAGGFGAAIVTNTPDMAFELASGDYDGDGKADIVVTRATFSAPDFAFHHGNGDGTFSPAVVFGGPDYCLDAESADVNGDGVLDLVATTKSHDRTQVWRGQGNGTFTVVEDHAAGAWTIRVAVGDVDGDTRPDALVSAQLSNESSLLLSNQFGTLGTPYANVQRSPQTLAIGDLDGDGKLDAVLSNQASNSISVVPGLGDGRWAARTDLATTTSPYGVAIGEVTGDIAPDIVVAAASVISYFPGLGGGAFGARVDVPGSVGGSQVRAVDLDGDGLSEIVVANSGFVAVYRATGGGAFAPRVDYAMAGSSNDLVVAKLDGDAFKDLATVTAGGIFVRKGIAGAAFGASVTWPAAAITTARALDCLDVNGDAIPDLVATGDALVALVNGGNADFGGQIVSAAANTPGDVALGDFDLDGTVDAMVAESNGAKIGFYSGHGDGTFGTRVPSGPAEARDDSSRRTSTATAQSTWRSRARWRRRSTAGSTRS